MFRRKSVWIGLVFVLMASALSMWAGRLPRVYANVTLISFTAVSLNGRPEVYIDWETATEIDTAGFYVQRSLTNQTDAYTRVSPFVPAEGDSLTGAKYNWIDETTTLNTLYYYRLEAISTDAAKPSYLYAPVSVIAGVAPTQTPTSTPPPVIYLPLVLRGI